MTKIVIDTDVDPELKNVIIIVNSGQTYNTITRIPVIDISENLT